MWGIIERGRRGGYGRRSRDRVLLLLAEETSHRQVETIDGDWGSAWVVETEEAIKQRTETVIEVAYGTMPS
jgi:hypothetical protein